MSGLLAGKVWHSALEAELKPLAATLADIADDDGTSLYPSIEFIAWRLSCSRASVDRGLRALREAGVLEVISQGGGRGKVTEYQLVEEKLPKRTSWKQHQIDVVSGKQTTSKTEETTSDLDETTSSEGVNHVIAVTQDSSVPVRGPVITRHSLSEEETPSPSKEREDPQGAYRIAKSIYRKYCRGNLGNLGEKQRESWDSFIYANGQEKGLGAFTIWARELGLEGKKFKYPIALFLKNSDEYIEAFEIEASPMPEEEEREEDRMLTAKDVIREREERERESRGR